MDAEAEDSKQDMKSKAAEEAAQQQKLAALVASGEYDKRKRELEYYFDAIRFIEPFEVSIPNVSHLMSSKNSSDVLECINYLVTANEFKIANSHTGVRKMLTHIWSKEQTVKDAVMSAYQRIYIGDPKELERQSHTYQTKFALSIAKNLICLTGNGEATLADIVCLEELMVQLMRQQQIPTLVIQALWDIFASKQNAGELAQKNGALLLLSMMAGADPSIITEHINTVITVGLVKRTELIATPPAFATVPASPAGANNKADEKSAAPPGGIALLDAAAVAKQNRDKLRLARTACIALQKLKASPAAMSALSPKMLVTIYTRLSSIIRDDWFGAASDIKHSDWYGACEQAIATVFALHPQPEVLSSELLKSMITAVFAGNGNGTGQQLNSHCDAAALSKLFFVAGHTAVKMLVHLEAVEARIKKIRGTGNSGAAKKAAAPAPAAESKTADAEAKPKKAAAAKKKKKGADSEDEPDAGEEDENDASEDEAQSDADEKAPPKKAAATKKKAGETGPAAPAAAAPEKSGEAKQSAIEEELAVNASEEYELEQMRERAERDLIDRERGNLLSVFGPILARVCAYPLQYADPMLQRSAVLALCKLMTVSSDFCDEHLRLLFTILHTSKDPKIKANVMISLGDMCFRFPNLLEPWSAHMYGRLRDADTGVRKNTLMVLSHLILNDMLKAKGPVAEMAKCLRDPIESITDLARLFFSELAKKGKDPIYNLLPDILSRLSRDNQLTTDDFNAIMKFLMCFIDKDKQTESLLEKLCHRFDDRFHIKSDSSANGETEFPMRKGQSKASEIKANAVASTLPAPIARDALCVVQILPANPRRAAAGGDLVCLEIGVLSAEAAAERYANAEAASSAALQAATDAMAAAAAKASGKPKTEAQRAAEAAEFQMQHWRDIAYCMSQLNCNEKCIRKLSQFFKFFARALADEIVYGYFVDITTKARKVYTYISLFVVV